MYRSRLLPIDATRSHFHAATFSPVFASPVVLSFHVFSVNVPSTKTRSPFFACSAILVAPSCGFLAFHFEAYAEDVLTSPMCMAVNVRTRLASIGVKLRYSWIIRISWVRRIGEAFEIEALRISKNIGHCDRTKVQEVKPEVSAECVRGECGPPFLASVLLVDASGDFFADASGDISFPETRFFRLEASLGFAHFGAVVAPKRCRHFTETICKSGFCVDHAAFDNHGRDVSLHKPRSQNNRASKIQALRLPYSVVNGATHEHGAWKR